MPNKKILITGAAGFIGFSLCRKMLAKGVDILALDNFSDYYDPRLKKARFEKLFEEFKKEKPNSEFIFEKLDLLDRKKLESLISTFKPDTICHLAAQAGVRYSLENPQSYIDNNITATLNLLEISKDIGVSDFILASTSSLYGLNQEIPFSENMNIDSTISPYSSSKRACELLCHTYHHIYNIKFRILRFFTVYGPWGRPDMALFKFTRAILANSPIDVFNSGNMKRDFTFVEDIVDGFMLAIDKPYDFEIFNLGFGKAIALEEFIEILENKLEIKAKKNYLPIQPGDVPYTWSDISKARKMLGYNPKYEAEYGVGAFVDWYKSYHNII